MRKESWRTSFEPSEAPCTTTTVLPMNQARIFYLEVKQCSIMVMMKSRLPKSAVFRPNRDSITPNEYQPDIMYPYVQSSTYPIAHHFITTGRTVFALAAAASATFCSFSDLNRRR